VNYNTPRLSIGIPVFNGERYLGETLDSLLVQKYSDFELIISDNASTDNTQEICSNYAAKDNRIHYFRNKINLGAAYNYNRVFNLAKGEYFKWAAHDDLYSPEFLEKCIEVLDKDNSAVLCYSRAKNIDEHGRVQANYASIPNFNLPKSSMRFFGCLCVSHAYYPIFGVIRRKTLKKTNLIGNYPASDTILLAKLVLLGKLHEIPDYLFFKRDCPQNSWRAYPSSHARQAWFDPTRINKIIFPHWRLLVEHFISILTTSLSWDEQIRCYIYLIWWIRLNWRYLAKNIILQEPND